MSENRKLSASQKRRNRRQKLKAVYSGGIPEGNDAQSSKSTSSHGECLTEVPVHVKEDLSGSPHSCNAASVTDWACEVERTEVLEKFEEYCTYEHPDKEKYVEPIKLYRCKECAGTVFSDYVYSDGAGLLRHFAEHQEGDLDDRKLHEISVSDQVMVEDGQLADQIHCYVIVPDQAEEAEARMGMRTLQASSGNFTLDPAAAEFVPGKK